MIDLTVREGDAQVLKLEFATEASTQQIWEALRKLAVPDSAERVVASLSSGGKGVGGRYEGLVEYLRGQEGTRVSIGFHEISAILDKALPPSALEYRAWWANDLTHSQAKAWASAGWKTADVDMANQIVVFERV